MFVATKDNSYVEKWKKLPWSKYDQDLFRLQHRIYKATQKGEYYKVKKLQSLILGSQGARSLAVRQITQLNIRKKTPGIDGIRSLNCKQRLQLVKDLKKLSTWEHLPLRKEYILKSNGEKRTLGIPTIRDRAVQCLIKYALEPVYEAQASNGSFGFRPGRSTWDIQSNIFRNLKLTSKGYEKIILELNIEKCFDKMDHNYIMSKIILPKTAKNIIQSALNAGVLNERITTTEGIQQGGVISPLLSNIAINGIEDLWNEKFPKTEIYQRGYRYADYMIFFLKPHENAERLRNKVDEFLAKASLNLKKSKIKLIKPTDGFDFLGWHFKVKVKNKKFVCYPSQNNYKQMIQNIKRIMRDTRFSIEQRLLKIKIVYKGWRNYHQYCDLRQINLWSIKKWLNSYLVQHSKIGREERIKHLRKIFSGHKFKINGFISVIPNKSPYDNDRLYWVRRGRDSTNLEPYYVQVRFKSFKYDSFLVESPLK